MRRRRLADEPAVVVLTYILAVGVLAAVTAVDVDVQRIPDALSMTSYPVFAALLACCSWADGDWGAYRRALVCCAVLWVLYRLLYWSRERQGLGYGDVKLGGVLGLLLGWLSWPTPFVAMFAAFLLGGVVALALVVSRRASLKTKIPFGPSMTAAAVLVLLISPAAVAGVFPAYT